MSRLKSVDVYIGAPYGIDINLSIGFHVSTKEKIKIDLFSIDKNHSHYFINNAPTICQKIIEQITLVKSIDEIEWTYTAAPAFSTFTFEALNGLAVIMRFDNGEVAKNYCGGLPLDDYEEALKDSRGFMVALQDGSYCQIWCMA